MWHIGSSVGEKGTNNSDDVKLIQALLNVYYRNLSKSTHLNISGVADQQTIDAIKDFQTNKLHSKKPDGRVDPRGKTFHQLIDVLKNQITDKKSLLTPKEGSVTFNSEGTEGGRYHSRVLHVPSSSSGLTIGRGYDMATKNAAKIAADLSGSGVDSKSVNVIKTAAGLKGAGARKFIVEHDLLDFHITPAAQKTLFEGTYADEAKETKRICTSKAVEKLYGKCDWDKLDTRIKQMLVDLKYRGDYTSTTRKKIQKHVAKNDFAKFKKEMLDSGYWEGTHGVPKDRFKLRKEFLEKTLTK
jgi:peptidoglycan hydrolase-like protein with peptidoglycan-binding domain